MYKNIVYYKCTLKFCCPPLEMLKHFKAGGILIGCQCFIIQQLEKNKKYLERESNDIVPFVNLILKTNFRTTFKTNVISFPI